MVGIFLNLHCTGPVTPQAHLRAIVSPFLFLLTERGSVLCMVLLLLSVLIVGYGAGPVLKSSDHFLLCGEGSCLGMLWCGWVLLRE